MLTITQIARRGGGPGSWRPPGRPAVAAAPAGHGGTPLACVPVRDPQSHAATELQNTHLKETT